jgi:hypothetical protein
MSDVVWSILGWLLIALALSPIALGIGWAIWQGIVRPRFIPRREIDQLADEVMENHPDDPEAAALREEHHHWYRSDEFEQGKWHRVRVEIRRRLGNT